MAPARIAAAAGMAALSLALCGQATAQKPATPPAPPPRIEGTVRDALGKPVEKALVLARPVIGDATARTLSVRVDASGRFALDVPKPGPYFLRIEAPGLAPHTVERLTVPAAPLAVTLRKGGAIEGVVKDGRGKPVAGARVDARVGARLGTLLSEPEAGRVRTTTDAKGVFKLDGLATTAHTVTATAPGLGGARRDGVAPGAKIELLLTPGASVQGVVRGPDRRPLSGASVMIEPETYGYHGSMAERTNAAGAFQVLGLPAGAWRVIAVHRDSAPAVARVFLERNAEQRVELTLGAPARVRGRLVDGEEHPIRGALVLQEIEDQVVAQSLGQVLRAESDAQGRFTLERLPRAPLALGVTAKGYTPRRIEASPDGAELDLGNVVLEQGLAIRGRVRDKAGQAIADAQVRTMFQAATNPMRLRIEGTTEADGTFVLAGAEPGPYRVSAQAPGFAVASTQASAGGDPIELTLERAGSITGTVVDEKGLPVPAFRVSATLPQDKPDLRLVAGDGSDGRFELSDVGAGDWTVQVKAPDKAEASVSGVKVRAGAATDAGRIRLSPGAPVRGRVTDSAGTPVAGASVWTDAPGRFARVMMSRDGARGTFTDASGAFELLGVEPGRVDVMADHPDFATGRLQGVDVDALRGAIDLRVTLGRGGRVEGTVRRRDGRPLERTEVRAMSLSPSLAPSSGLVAPDGSFALDHVAPGTTRVALSNNAVSGISAVAQKQVDVREGETSVVDFLVRDILVSGTVTRRGEPAPGVRITLRGMFGQMYSMPDPGVVAAPPAGPQYGSAVSRGDGGYELLISEPGTYMANVTSADGLINYPMRRIEVPDADTTTADLAFGGVPVSGQVVDADTSAPLTGRVFAAPKAGEPGRPATTQSGPDGRFQLELDPGEFTVSATADGYAGGRTPVTVSERGAGEVRLALTRGVAISGRVLDASGRPVGALMVSALSEGDFPPGGVPMSRSGFGDSGPDGAFMISGLAEGRYTLSSGDELAGFGVMPDVAAGSKGVALRLAPGGRVRATVFRPDGSPAHPMFVSLTKVDGRSIMISRAGGQTDTNGVAEFSVPAGNLGLRGGDLQLEGTAAVAVSPGETVAVEIRLAARKKDPASR